MVGCAAIGADRALSPLQEGVVLAISPAVRLAAEHGRRVFFRLPWPPPTRRSPRRSPASCDRQQSQIELIASENIVSRAVLEAQGSVLTNKYAEGYPGRRYYGGCEFVDVAERLAIERAKRLFGCGFANVQPHAGAPANQAVFLALLKPGDTILGMSLAAGGHLTHGARAEPVGQMVPRGRPTACAPRTRGSISTRSSAWPRQHRPKLIIAGGSAYPRIIDFARFRAIADEVGAYLMVDMAHFAGLVAGGVASEPAAARACRHDDDAQDACAGRAAA